MKAKTIVRISIFACIGLGVLIGIPAYKQYKIDEWERVQELRFKYIQEDTERNVAKIQAKHKEFAEILDDLVVTQDNMKYVFEHGGKDDKKVMEGVRDFVGRLKDKWESYPYFKTPFPKYTVDENGFIDLDAFADGVHKGMIEEWEKARKEGQERLEKAKKLERPKAFGIF